MTTSGSNPATGLQSHLQSRSIGLKLLIVGALALLMTIPALFVSNLLQDRTNRAADVMRDVSHHVGGPQTFLGPTLAIPYIIPSQYPGDPVKHGTYFVFPATGESAFKTSTEERRRSLFKVPVFRTDAKFDAAFDLHGVPAAAPIGALLDWPHAEIFIGVSDARGAIADANITVDGKNLTRNRFDVGGGPSRHRQFHSRRHFPELRKPLSKPDLELVVQDCAPHLK